MKGYHTSFARKILGFESLSVHAQRTEKKVTTPKVKTIQIGEDRYYSDEVTQNQVPGVTSILNMRAKPALMNWAAKSAAEFAVFNLNTVSELARTDKFAAIDLVKRAHTRMSGNAAGKGTEVHGIIERLLNGETGVKVSNDVRPFIVQFQTFASEYKLVPIHNEITLWNDRYRYAGTADGIWQLDGLGIAVCDIKTGKSGVWDDAALQVSAYRNAEFMVFPDGTRHKMLETSPIGYALWLRPEGYALLPLDIGPETFRAFLGLREVFHWHNIRAKAAVGSALNAAPLKKSRS